jgi:hypothetical protein
VARKLIVGKGTSEEIAMKLRTLAIAVLAALALAACGQTGSDPAVTSAPASASNAPPTDPATTPAGAPADTVGTPAAIQSYQQDTAAPADKTASAPPLDEALAHCRQLDTAQQGECEMQARQGLDPQRSGVLDPVPERQTPPTDRVPADDTATQEDDDYE